MSDLDVLIVGASVAGPTAAYWFAKAGANVTIIERFPRLRPGGQNIDIRTAGVTVMRKMPGMEAAVRAESAQVEGLSFVNDNGEPFATMTATGDPDQQSLVSEFEIFRDDLTQVLFDLTKDNKKIKYVFGEQVASMRQNNNDPITVEFQGSLPTSQFDLVVACDGATSRTRAIGLDCGVRDHIIPLNCWAAYFTIGRDLLQGSKVSQGWSTIGGRFAALGPDPSGANRAVMMNINPRGNRDATAHFREAAKQGEDALKDYIARLYGGSGWKTDEIIEGMMTSTNFYASELVQVKVPRIYKGRFALVGDAGYAPGPTGNGTSLAMAGAYVLAGEIRKHKGDLAAGLQGYEERMTPIIKDMQKIPPGVPTVMAPQTAWGIWLRNLVLIVITWGMSVGGLVAPALGFLISAFGSDKYNLPDYEWE